MHSTMNRPHEELRADPKPSLEELMILELPRLGAFVQRLTRGANPALEADDVVQETVARALRFRASFDAQRPIGPWLCKMALRLVLDRRAALRRDEEQRAEFARARAREAGGEVFSGCDQETLDRWTARLSSVERDVLMRFHQRGETLREISTSLRMPEGTVKSHLHRARKKLAERQA